MKKLIIASTAFATFLATPVLAAPPSPAPVYNWSGWYAGVNAGASFGRAKTDFNNAPLTFTALLSSATFGAGGPGSDIESPGGFVGGGQIGYNWQFSPIWVVGFEADFQGALETDSASLNNPLATTPISQVNTGGNIVAGTSSTAYTTKIDWFGTVRLRAGYVWGNGDVFSYLTGGVAYGKVDLSGTNAVSGVLDTNAPFSFNSAFGHSQVNTGWVVGYGTEGRLGATNWTWKVESLYIDLGTSNTTSITNSSISSISGITSSGGQVSTHTHFTDGILRGGLNYRFY